MRRTRKVGPRGEGRRLLDLLVTVTFNDNQLRAHLAPLIALPEVRSITVVADATGRPLPKTTVVVPPRLLVLLMGRAGAKLAVCLALAIRRRPDWILGYNLVPHGLTATAVGRLARVRSGYHMIGGSIEWEGGGWRSENALLGRLPRPVRVLERLLLRAARASTAVVTMGERAREELLHRGFRPERVVAIPPSVDERRYRPVQADREYDLLSVGRLEPLKRPADVVEAVAKLREEYPGIRAAIAGSGSLEPLLRRRVAELELEGAVDFLGFRPDTETLYQRARIFLLTSSFEGLSISLLDAMACGLAAVASDVGETRTLVRDGETGFLYPAGDLDLLVERVGRLLGDRALCERVGAAAAAHSRQVGDVERLASRYGVLFGAGPEGHARARRPAVATTTAGAGDV